MLARILAVVAVFFCGPWAHADWDDLVHLAGLAPARCELVIVVDDASTLRRTPAGAAIGGVIRDANLLEQTASAWQELARKLRLGEDEAFDLLFGRRAVLVVDGLGGDAAWALLSEVDADTERLLRTRLDSAPRHRVKTRPVFTLERGRYELTTTRKGSGAAFLITPRGSGLLGACAPLLLGEPDGNTLSDEDVFGVVERLRTGQVLAVWRGGGGRFAAWSAQSGRTLSASMVSSPGTFWGPESCCVGFRLWEPDLANEMRSGALFAAVGILGDHERLAAHARGLLEAGMFAGVIDEIEPLASERFAVALRSAGDGRVGVEISTELADARSSAPLIDRTLTRAFTRARGLPSPGREVADVLSAIGPESIRTSGLNGFGNGLLGSPAFGAWTYAGAGEEGGWLTLRLGPRDSNIGAIERNADALARRRTGGSDPRVSSGVIRPGALVELCELNGFVLPDVLRAWRGVDRIEWDAWLDRKRGLVESSVLVLPE